MILFSLSLDFILDIYIYDSIFIYRLLSNAIYRYAYEEINVVIELVIIRLIVEPIL